MKQFHRILLLLVTTFVVGAACAQVMTEHKRLLLDSLFHELEVNHMSMATFSIYENGSEVYSRTYGYATIRPETTVPAETGKTLYRIGSVSKIFTAYLVMKLVEEGKLSLDQDISRYFPKLNDARAITIRSMLSHRSLLPIYHRVDDLDKMRQTKSEEELIALVNKRNGNTDTAKIVYNNLNYTLLGLVVEKIEGKPYNDVLQEHLAIVSGARAYGKFTLLDAVKYEANSFHVKGEQWIEDFEMREWPLPDASGFLVSDAQTLNTFMGELFAGKLLREDLLQEMLPKQQTFGYGLMKTNFLSHKAYGHSGRIEGFTSATTYFPEEKLSVTLLQNGTVYPLNDILILIGNILFDEPVEIPTLSRIALSTEQIRPLLGTYTNEEEGYSTIVDLHKGELRLRVRKGKGLINKMILPVYALTPTRLFNPGQGILFDFQTAENGSYSICKMSVNGAALPMKRIQ